MTLQRVLSVAFVLAPAFGSHLSGLPDTARQHLSGSGALEFLRSARIESSEEFQGGINRLLRIQLEEDGIQRRAVFRDVFRHEMVGEWHFPDSFVSEVAAFELSRLLELDVVPATVRRSVGGRDGALQLWIEDAMTEAQRLERGLEAPALVRFEEQIEVMHVFDNLIGNTDRHAKNILIDRQWRVWLIDHTRSFSRNPVLMTPEPARRCSQTLWEKLHSLKAEEVHAHLQPLLGDEEVEALLERWKLVIEQLQERIDALGVEQVIFGDDPDGFPTPEESRAAPSGPNSPKSWRDSGLASEDEPIGP